MRLFPTLGGLQLLALLGAAIVGVATVNAATLTVTTTADAGAGSLRDAIAAASDGDTIQFDPALNGQTISLTSGELVVDANITISGPGSDLLTVSRSAKAPNFRIFHVLIGHTVTIQGLAITGGYANGGGIFNDNANLTINSCIIRDNASPLIGGGIENGGGSTDGNASLTILDSTITGNRAQIWGGGIYTAPPSEFNSATLTLTNSVVSYNQAVSPTSGYGAGGGIFGLLASYVTLNNSTVSHNIAGAVAGPTPGGDGGGIYSNGAIVQIIDSTIDNNQSGGSGGGISNTGGDGSVNLYIANSSLFGNEALGEGSGPNGDGGGAIFTVGMCLITNSTLSDNYAAASGGGILTGSRLRIIHSTLSGNRADKGGGGISNSAGGSIWTLEVGEVILKTGSTGANLVSGGGTVTSFGYNLSDDDGGGFLTATGDQINTEPLLGPLQNNGGPTFTHELLTGSPAIDAGNPSFTPPPANDQRGPAYVRVFNGRIDIGSLEVQSPPPTPTPSPTPTATATATASPPATATPTPTLTPPPTATATATASATPTATPSPTAHAQSLNLSSRMFVQTGDRVGIAGLIIAGSEPKRVILRVIHCQVCIPEIFPLLDPVLELHGPNGFATIINNNWRDTQEAEIIATGLPPVNGTDSAIVVTLAPGNYTAIGRGNLNITGTAVLEVYDLDHAAASKLANISTRAFVGTDENILIAGFILGHGTMPDPIIVRGIGPSLTGLGVPDALANPRLELRDSHGALNRSNDNWMDDPTEAALIMAAGLAPTNPLESAIAETLPPGQYTALLYGVNDGTGNGLVEVYDGVGQP